MEIKQLFRPADLLVGFTPADKWQAIHQLVEHLVAGGRLLSAQASAIEQHVLARERSMSTGMERGIAIPHAAVDEVSSVQACMGICPRERGLDFASIDGQSAHFIVLLVIPRAQKLLHIRTLADVARVLGQASVREALLAAATPEQAWKALEPADTAARRTT
jgi:mannitol/fructose-specific phosphotransferase system IIA component (Ntr-type)